MERSNFKFEVCANSVESCIAAQQGGADRVELCAGILEGGTTPSYGEIVQARKLLSKTLLHVIIRPRGGDFFYSDMEIERMALDIRMAKKIGVDGVVFGCLNRMGEIDIKKNAYLMNEAAGLSVTFHRAFDHCRDAVKSLEELINLGFNRVLTSGQQPTAIEGTDLLSKLNTIAAGRIVILAGCGVNEMNISQLYSTTKVHEFHFSAREFKKSEMLYANQSVYMGAKGVDELSLPYTTVERVKQTISALFENNALV